MISLWAFVLIGQVSPFPEVVTKQFSCLADCLMSLLVCNLTELKITLTEITRSYGKKISHGNWQSSNTPSKAGHTGQPCFFLI